MIGVVFFFRDSITLEFILFLGDDGLVTETQLDNGGTHLSCYFKPNLIIFVFQDRLVQQYCFAVFIVFNFGYFLFLVQDNGIAIIPRQIRFELRRKSENCVSGAQVNSSSGAGKGLFDLILRFGLEDLSDDIGGLSFPDQHVVFEGLGCEDIGIDFLLGLIQHTEIICIQYLLLFYIFSRESNFATLSFRSIVSSLSTSVNHLWISARDLLIMVYFSNYV